LIEKVRTNVALYSQQYDNAAWAIVGGASVAANTTTAPDGTLTADTLTVATNNFSGLAQTISKSTNSWTISLFFKRPQEAFIASVVGVFLGALWCYLYICPLGRNAFIFLSIFISNDIKRTSTFFLL
jgi:hypothetical protein